MANTFHIFQCREGEFTCTAGGRAEAEDKALAAYLIRRIRTNPQVPSDEFAKWRSDFMASLASSRYRTVTQ